MANFAVELSDRDLIEFDSEVQANGGVSCFMHRTPDQFQPRLGYACAHCRFSGRIIAQFIALSGSF